MSDHFFISYSSVDGLAFSLKLADDLLSGPPVFSVWIDKRHLRPSEDWDGQVVEAIRGCKGFIFVMTNDSVSDGSVCKQEWTRALRYKKPIIPLLLSPDAEMPFRLEPRQHIDFSSAYDSALARLRKHLGWMDSPEGRLQALKHRLADAQRDLPRAQPDLQPRIQDDITEIKRQIAQQEALIANPQAAQQRVQQSIDLGLERVRQPANPIGGVTQTKFINPPPLVAPTWFQNRHVETQLIGDFLKDDALRLMTVVGRGGIGKSALACRLLRALEAGQLPDDGGPLPVDGIVYLSDARSFHRVSVPDLYAGLSQLLSDETRRKLDTVYKNPQADTRQTMQALLDVFPHGRTIVLLDNFEDEVDVATGHMRNAALDEALRALLELPPHGLKVMVTTRIAARDLALVEPGRQRRLDLDTGLDHPYAENILRAMDADGKIGLRDAPEALLGQARVRTRGYPRALEHLFGILSADRDTGLQEILDNTKQLLPDQVVTVLVGEAFSRLDLTAQRVMQALAIFRYPVPSPAVDYLLQPYVPGVDSGPVLSRLVNMQFVRRDAGRYYLHQIDRDYAESRIPEGTPADRDAASLPFTRFALHYRAAEWFKLARKPRESWRTLDDVAAQLSEFELRFACQDFDTAAALLLGLDQEFLTLWGHYLLVIELHRRLQGNITDPALAQSSVASLGFAFAWIGDNQQAIDCFERALSMAREAHNRWNEGVWLGGLAQAFAELGQTDRAIEFFDLALNVSREVGDRNSEATNLSNLGNQHANHGDCAGAIQYYQQALRIFREINARPYEATVLCNLGCRYSELEQVADALQYLDGGLALARETGYRVIEAGARTYLGRLYLDQGDWEKAALTLKQAVEIADDTANAQFQQFARVGLAEANLSQGNLPAAREIAKAAGDYNVPLTNHRASAILGMIAFRQADRVAARDAFETALKQASELLARGSKLFTALDIKGLALCGLALCGDSSHIPAAKEAYQAARALTSASGIVARVLRLFDTLAQADSEAILAGVRPLAAGEQSAAAPNS